MILYFFRHGEADWPDWKKPDDERPLTQAGQKEVRRVAKFLRDLKVKPDVILTSPLPRAYQTAELIAKKIERRVETEPRLKKGFDVKKLERLMEKYPGEELMIVGHEPDFSAVLQELTGARVKLAKSGVARVDFDGEENRLVWLFPPKLTRV